MKWLNIIGLSLALVATTPSFAQPPHRGGPPPAREHTVKQSSGTLDLVPANSETKAENKVTITLAGRYRVIRANGIPDHPTGPFPNQGNPHSIKEQSYTFMVESKPKVLNKSLSALGEPFGIGVNGVVFDPGAAEWYLGIRSELWQYEPLSGAIRLGLDANHAHVQPSGAYHYHGLPTGLLDGGELSPQNHSPIVGWAADGFPIYVLYGFSDPKNPASRITQLASSFRLKTGTRPGGDNNPGGTYDGTFVGDYEYVPGSGDLDECNGRKCVTPEFPSGTYAYFLTETWPVIPRRFMGTPSKDFERRRRGPPRGK